jgi:hypothetical protein
MANTSNNQKQQTNGKTAVTRKTVHNANTVFDLDLLPPQQAI